MSMESLPREIVIQIANQVRPGDINSLLQTNSGFTALLRTTLLDSITDRGSPDVAQRALHAFAKRGDNESVLRLLHNGVIDIIGTDRALHEVIEKGPESVVCNLWRSGVKLRTRDDQERTPVMIAAKQGYTEAVRMMMEDGGFDINEQDKWLRTALYTAVGEGNESTVAMLMSHPGIDPNMTDQFGDTPLHVAAECGWGGITSLLLSNPRILINTKDARGMAPFHIAVILENLEVVNVLLKDPRLRINERGRHYQTALHMAASQKSKEMVHALLQHPEIDPALPGGLRCGRHNIRGAAVMDHPGGCAPLIAAVQSHNEVLLQIADGRGPDLDHDEGNFFGGNTPAHRAAYRYYQTLAMLFLHPESTDIDVHVASSEASVKCLAMQEAYDAEINQAIMNHVREKSRPSLKRNSDTPTRMPPNKKGKRKT